MKVERLSVKNIHSPLPGEQIVSCVLLYTNTNLTTTGDRQVRHIYITGDGRFVGIFPDESIEWIYASEAYIFGWWAIETESLGSRRSFAEASQEFFSLISLASDAIKLHDNTSESK